jgi:hypothetical protein
VASSINNLLVVKIDVTVVGILKATEEKSRIWIRVRDPQIRIRMKKSQTGTNASDTAVFQMRKPPIVPYVDPRVQSRYRQRICCAVLFC